MGLLDDLENKAVTGIFGSTSSPLAAAVLEMISNHPGGLPGLLESFHEKGLGEIASSWVGTGQNLPISSEQIGQVLASDQVQQLAAKAGLSPDLARLVAVQLTAHDALAAHAEAEYGITAASRIAPFRETFAVSAAFAAGALLPWLAIMLIPGPSRALVTFAVVLAGLALTGWVSARISQVQPIVPMIRTASIGGLSMLITYFAGHLFHP